MAFTESLLPGSFYHLFSRGVNREPIFHADDDYRFFLEKYAIHVVPIVDTFAYCLMGNHFHTLIQVKEHCLLAGQATPVTPQMASQAIGNCLNAYVKMFNRKYERTGSLFERPFKRVPIKDESHLLTVVAYIHQNPRHHGFVDDFREWPWSSFEEFFVTTPSLVERSACLHWFDGLGKFQAQHLTRRPEEGYEQLIIDDWG